MKLDNRFKNEKVKFKSLEKPESKFITYIFELVDDWIQWPLLHNKRKIEQYVCIQKGTLLSKLHTYTRNVQVSRLELQLQPTYTT